MKRRGEAVELEPPPMPVDAWSEGVDYFRRMLPLESRMDRRLVQRLMLALDSEALAIFKVARRLEEPGFTPKDYAKLRVHHGRTAIVDRLRRDFAEKYVEIVQLDDLYERIGLLSRHWYHQGGVILDRVESLRISLAIYELQLSKIRRRPGRSPSVAWHFLVGEQMQRGLSDEEVVKSLVRVGHIADHEGPRRSLQESIRKRRERRATERRATERRATERRSRDRA